MCDTLAMVESGRVLFAKNSDRDANEAQSLEWHPRREYPEGAQLQCTWIAIPQVRETRAVLLSRPFWMWGAEMGTNEEGVTIGNEAVFTRQPHGSPGLTGMDLLRLALERSVSARDACAIITTLLETHGQGGGCGHENRRFTYHNSFIVADRYEGYVLETAGKHWACAPIDGVAAISNGLTLPGFAEKHSDTLKTLASACAVRRARVLDCARSVQTEYDLFQLLRDHGDGQADPHYSPLNGGMAAPCMHAGGLVAASQTTASWVSELTPGGDRHWVTATAAPCTSLFKPVTVSEPVGLGPFPTDRADQGLWWRHERFHRRVLRNPARYFPLFQPERDAVELEWVSRPPTSDEAFTRHADLLERWMDKTESLDVDDIRPVYVRRYWASRGKRCAL